MALDLDRIENIAEDRMTQLDSDLINGHISQANYDEKVKSLNSWVKERSFRFRHEARARGFTF